MPPRFTVCDTCQGPISDFPKEATRLYGRPYKQLVKTADGTFDPECAEKASKARLDAAKKRRRAVREDDDERADEPDTR